MRRPVVAVAVVEGTQAVALAVAVIPVALNQAVLIAAMADPIADPNRNVLASLIAVSAMTAVANHEALNVAQIVIQTVEAAQAAGTADVAIHSYFHVPLAVT